MSGDGIKETLVTELTERFRDQFRIAKPDSLREEALEDAFGRGFKGDEDALWDAIKRRLQERPPQKHAVQKGDRNRGKPVPPWEFEDNDLVTAPYRFAPLSDKVSHLPTDERTPLNHPLLGNLCAVLDVDWVIETPMLIGNQGDGECDKAVDGPFRLGDDWAIPGATLRGAIRAILETVAFGRLFQINRHRRFALRDFDHPEYAKFSREAVTNLRTGWLQMIEGKPKITPCDYGYLRISDLVGSESEEKIREWITQSRADKYDKSEWDTPWKDGKSFTRTHDFAFDCEDEQGRRIFRPGKGKPGICVFSDMIPAGSKGTPNKQFENVFFDGAGRPVQIDDRIWDEFINLNSKPSKNRSRPDGAWRSLSQAFEEGGRVPIFYTGDLLRNATDKLFSFGLTRLYRRPHIYSIGDILAQHPAHLPRVEKSESGGRGFELQPDFVEHLFGYVYEPDELIFGQDLTVTGPDCPPPKSVARKGRVAFGFARATRDDYGLWPAQPLATVMGAPKPQFAPFYLIGVEKDYSSPKSRLAGRKRYIPRSYPADTNVLDQLRTALKPPQGAKFEQQSLLQFLVPRSRDSVFRGRIRLRNVSEAELGAILWALTFGGDTRARHLIGRAKAFGAGRCRVGRITLNVRPNGRDALNPTEWHHHDERRKLEPYLHAFEQRILDLIGHEDKHGFRALPGVRDLLAIACPRPADAKGTTYLPFTDAHGGRPGAGFSTLRTKTRLGAAASPGARPPDRLLRP